ncbi:MAG: DUF3261 domain-containing protein, partial [Undibacterium sp.]|nr:DUF3261 domain-containing protein [Undibacterium sp.]
MTVKRSLRPILWLQLFCVTSILAACGTPAPKSPPISAPISTPISTPPKRLGLQLPPHALGATISVQQHLKVERAGRIDELDAALEVDAEHLQLVGLAFGQRVLSLLYDGK